MIKGWRGAALAAASALLGACAIEPRHDPYVEERVYLAPPPVQYEYVGRPPMADAVWIAGYWNWGGARYVWVPGRWEAPRPGYHWLPHRWEQDDGHWRQHGGRWEREAAPRQQPQQPPPRARPDDSRRPDPGPFRSRRDGHDREDR